MSSKGAHKGFCVIPKSVTPKRIESNFDDLELSAKEFEAISKVGRENPVRYNIPYLYKPRWDIDVFGTSYCTQATNLYRRPMD